MKLTARQGGQKASPRELLENMLGHLGFVFQIQEEERDGIPVLQIQTSSPGRLIGHAGTRLEDLQYLLNILLHHHEEAARVLIDVEGYRLRQREDLLAEIKEYADDVRRTGQPVKLPEMNSFDRRLVHLAYQNDPELQTISQPGEQRLKSMTLALRHPKKQ